MKALHINGNDLTPEAVREVAVERRPVLLDPDAREAVNRARAIVDSVVAQNQLSYAITTGVGKLSEVTFVLPEIRFANYKSTWCAPIQWASVNRFLSPKRAP